MRLTFASTRKNRPDHGSCLRNTRARLSFPLTTSVRISRRQKKDIPNPALRVKVKLLAVLKIIVKRSGQMKTIQAQCNFSATKWIYRGVETILLKSYLGWAPSTVCLKSLVTGHDDHNQRQVQCQPLSGVAGRS